ncbi:GNAT family N-acetyltransferase [Cloacibacillus evryensis]|uniref:GNAT family N-acetyltransferase n=1 Tax=Cloacibacillus evryensis TaxID=508460 RepID=UPI00242039E2|nr:GNAT family N-acetyltransferase [Cloacibacillus evryensis]
MREIIVETERLRIVPLNAEELRLLRDREADDGMKEAYGEMMDTMRRSPGREEWGTYWKICLTSGTRVGGLCFKGAPDAEGSVEIGYGIDEAYRRNGYALEAVTGIIKWVSEQSGVCRVTAQTEETNAASGKVLLKSGFVKVGAGEEGLLYNRDLCKTAAAL